MDRHGIGNDIARVPVSGRGDIAGRHTPLDAAGNSVRAQKAITDISNALGGNPYAAK